MENTEKIIDYKAYKWLVSSCLQKSIRRGRYDLAQEYMKYLWEHDRNYITYRFGTMLAEDVGIANMPLVSEYLQTKLAKRAIDDAGGLDFMLRLTKDACDSVKDRSSCDAGYMSGFYSLSGNDNLIKVYSNVNNHYVDRLNASWIILGNKKFDNANLVFNHDENIDDYITLISSNTSAEFAVTVANAYATQRENICLGMPVIYSAYMHEQSLEQNPKLPVGKIIENMYVKETSFYHEATNLHIISAGVDGHTKEGKSIYYQYLKSRNEFVKYLNSYNIHYEQHIDILKHCMFRVEGHEVNKRLYFPTAVNVMRECEANILNIKAGLPANTLDFNIIKNILIKDMPLINSMRKYSLENTPVIMKDPPAPKKPRKNKV